MSIRVDSLSVIDCAADCIIYISLWAYSNTFTIILQVTIEMGFWARFFVLSNIIELNMKENIYENIYTYMCIWHLGVSTMSCL